MKRMLNFFWLKFYDFILKDPSITCWIKQSYLDPLPWASLDERSSVIRAFSYQQKARSFLMIILQLFVEFKGSNSF